MILSGNSAGTGVLRTEDGGVFAGIKSGQSEVSDRDYVSGKVRHRAFALRS